MESFIKEFQDFGTLIGVVITAFATIALWRQTRVLAVETRRLADASSTPHIVMTLTRNQWSFSYFQLEVLNSGNATAYDIQITTLPPLNELDARNIPGASLPFEKIGVLAPNQRLMTELGNYAALKGKTIEVQTSWSKTHGGKVRDFNVYTMSISDFEGQSLLGESNPLVKLANDFKTILRRNDVII